MTPMQVSANPVQSAKVAALRYVSAAGPGIQRRRSGRHFSYVDPDGRTIRDAAVLARIRSLAVPPAWTSVWICTLPDGHLQATGRDARGRKQYRYHPRWRAVRDETKYGRLLRFARTLPRIRARVQQDLDQPGLSRTKLLAMVVQLLETTFIRIGNEEYARSNGSFGLTTLQGHHVEVNGTRIHFQFRGKSGKVRRVAITNGRLARLVRRCRELPGKELFQYLDENGEPQPIGSADVNEYLKLISGQDFTAKDFRTWAGSLLAACRLMEEGGAATRPVGSSAAVATVRAVAEQLGNTPAVCRKAYIHPLLLACYEDPPILERWDQSARGRVRAGLSPAESRLIRFLAMFPATTRRGRTAG